MTPTHAIRLVCILSELQDHVAETAAIVTVIDPDDLSTYAANAVFARHRGKSEEARQLLLETAATAILLIDQLDAEAEPAQPENLITFR